MEAFDRLFTHEEANSLLNGLRPPAIETHGHRVGSLPAHTPIMRKAGSMSPGSDGGGLASSQKRDHRAEDAHHQQPGDGKHRGKSAALLGLVRRKGGLNDR